MGEVKLVRPSLMGIGNNAIKRIFLYMSRNISVLRQRVEV